MSARPVILVTGADGQVGYELRAQLAGFAKVHATTRRELDLADPDAVARTVRTLRPAVIVNGAAYTAVDRAETEPEVAFRVNAEAPGIMAAEAHRAGALLVHFSTDYVFDGAAHAPYREDAPTGPLNVYGASKLAGERAIAAAGARALVFRTSWVYAERGSNFLLTMRRLARERDELRVVADQIGVPNSARAIASAVVRVLQQGIGRAAERAGLYHLSCSGAASWYDFASAIVGANARTRVVPITTAEFPRPARRPAYGVLDGSRFAEAFGFALPPWREDLADCLHRLAD